jgi:hypothetical protein
MAKAKKKREHKDKPILKKVRAISKSIPKRCSVCGGSGFVSKCSCCGSPIPYGKK